MISFIMKIEGGTVEIQKDEPIFLEGTIEIRTPEQPGSPVIRIKMEDLKRAVDILEDLKERGGRETPPR